MRFQSPFIAGALLWAMTTVPVLGEPVTFAEVSLLVRMKEAPAEIENQIARRKLIAPLTAQEIATLQAQGASEQVIQVAQDPRNHLSYKAAVQFQRAKAAAALAAAPVAPLATKPQAVHPATRASSLPAPAAAAAAADDRNTELKYAKEAIERGKPLNLARYGGSDTDIFVKGRSEKFYTVEIGNNERRIPVARPVAPVPVPSPDDLGIPKARPVAPGVVPSPSGATSFPAEMLGTPGSRTRKKVEKSDPVRISTERSDLYLAYVDKPSGIHVYLLDDTIAAPINADLLIVSPKKF